jgi:hypothetical protein
MKPICECGQCPECMQTNPSDSLPGFGGNLSSDNIQFVPAEFKNHLRSVMNEKIQRVDGGWAVYPSKGGKRLGTHPTKKAALKQLAAIEISKMKK